MNNCRTADELDKVAAYFAKFEAMSKPSESAWAAAIKVNEAKDRCPINKTENPEKKLARQRKWAKSNIEKRRELNRIWERANPERCAAKNSKRRARKNNAAGSYSAAEIKAIFTAQRGLCANCNTHLFKSGKQKYHVDHVMPLALGGSNWPSNLQCLCPRCNLSKGAKHPDVWAKEQGRML